MTSSLHQRTRSAENDEQKRPFLPVLIIPGFMSSGLYVVKSTHEKSWEDKRIWINLKSLGFEAAYMIRSSDIMKENNTTSNNNHVRMDDESSSHHADDDDSPQEEKQKGAVLLRNKWLQHMALRQDDMITEREGVQVRNISGLSGVDYLTPGALTNHVSYVFGPVIRALQNEAGYKEGVTLDAAPYDWRLPPSALEERDQYFTRTMIQVEYLYSQNKNTPVVLLCHSLGCKMGHYFLNFAERKRGRAWIDRYIHTYMPVGGPHLGAPTALRSVVSGEKMGLEAFLSDSESLIFGRSLGSGPFLLPRELPPDASSSAFLREDGAIEVTIPSPIDSDIFLNNREDKHRPNKLKLTIVFDKNGLSTPFCSIEADQSVTFNETFTFRTPADGPHPKANLAILLCEPGLNRARRSMTGFQKGHNVCFDKFFRVWKCDCCSDDPRWGCPDPNRPVLCWLNIIFFWWLIWPIIRYSIEFAFKVLFGTAYCTLWCLCVGTVLTADELAKVSGGSSVLAAGKVKRVRSVLDTASSDDHVDLDVELVSERDRQRLCSCCWQRRSTTVTVRIKWLSANSTALQNDVCSPVCQQPCDGRSVTGFSTKKKANQRYMPRSGFDLFTAEGLSPIIETIKRTYDNDPLDPRGLSSSSPPPVRLVKAIYGINLPTEVGAIYKRHPAEIDCANKVHNFYTLDKNARLEESQDGYIVEDGIVKETNCTKQLIKGPPGMLEEKYECKSGDGTVPYWSLQHVRTWENECQVSIEELEGAVHREILADKRFHKIIVDYVCSNPDAGGAV